MADAKVHTSVADLVTKLHTNIDSIHATLSALTTTSHAHHAELERLSLEREHKIAELRASHENALRELAVQREKDAEELVQQREREQEELEEERQKEYELLLTKRKQEDEEREKIIQEQEVERLKAVQEEDAKREAERDEQERLLQENVERELELLEDEMERKVEEGRQALRDLDERRKAINADIDAALNKPSVIPPIFFRSRSKTQQGLTNGTKASNGASSLAWQPRLPDIQTISEAESKNEEETDIVETPLSDGLSVVNGSREIHLEEEDTPLTVPKVIETEEVITPSVPDHIIPIIGTRQMPIDEDSVPETTHETQAPNAEDHHQSPIVAEFEYNNETTFEHGKELATSESNGIRDISETDGASDVPGQHIKDVKHDQNIDDEHEVIAFEPEREILKDEPIDSLSTYKALENIIESDGRPFSLPEEQQSKLEDQESNAREISSEAAEHQLTQHTQVSLEHAVVVSISESVDESLKSEPRDIALATDTELTDSTPDVSDSTPHYSTCAPETVKAILTEEPTNEEAIDESAGLSTNPEHSLIEAQREDNTLLPEYQDGVAETQQASDTVTSGKDISSQGTTNGAEHSNHNEISLQSLVPELDSENDTQSHNEPVDLDLPEATPEHDAPVQEGSNIDLDQDLASSQSEVTETGLTTHIQPESFPNSQADELFGYKSENFHLAEGTLSQREVDESEIVLVDPQDSSLDGSGSLEDENSIVASHFPVEVEGPKRLEDALLSHHVQEEDKNYTSGETTPRKSSIDGYATYLDNLEALIANSEIGPRTEDAHSAGDLPTINEAIEEPAHPLSAHSISGRFDKSFGKTPDIDDINDVETKFEITSEELSANEPEEELTVAGKTSEVDGFQTQGQYQVAHLPETKPHISASRDTEEGGPIYSGNTQTDIDIPKHNDVMDGDVSGLVLEAEKLSLVTDKTLQDGAREFHESKEDTDMGESSAIRKGSEAYDSALQPSPSIHTIERSTAYDDDTRETSTDDDFESALSDGGSASTKYEPSAEEHLPHFTDSLNPSDHFDKIHDVVKDEKEFDDNISHTLALEEKLSEHSNVLAISPTDLELPHNTVANIPTEHSITPAAEGEVSGLKDFPLETADSGVVGEPIVLDQKSEDTTPRRDAFSAETLAHTVLEHGVEPVLLDDVPTREDESHLNQDLNVEPVSGTNFDYDPSEMPASYHQIISEEKNIDAHSSEAALESEVIHHAQVSDPELLSHGESKHEEDYLERITKTASTAHDGDIQPHQDLAGKDLELLDSSVSLLEDNKDATTEAKEMTSLSETSKLKDEVIAHNDAGSASVTGQLQDLGSGEEREAKITSLHTTTLNEDDVSKAGFPDIETHQGEGVRLSASSSREPIIAEAASLNGMADVETKATILGHEPNTVSSTSKSIDVFKFLDPEDNETPGMEAAYDTMDEGSLKDGAPLNGSTGPLLHTEDREKTLTPDLYQAVVGSHANRSAESPVTVLHMDSETDETDSDTSDISGEESGAEAEDEEGESEEDEEAYDSDGSESEEEEFDDPVPVSTPSKIERNFPHVIQSMPSYEFGKPKMLDPFSDGSNEQIDFSSSRSSGLYSSLVDTIKSDPVVKQMGNNGASGSPQLEDEYPRPAEVTDAMKAQRLVQNAFQKTDTEDDAPFHDSFSDHQPSNTHYRSHTADTVPSIEPNAQSDADSAVSETPSSPFADTPRQEPLIASPGPLHEQVSEEPRELKPDISPLRAEFDPYGSNTYPKYIKSKQSQADLKSPINSPRSPRNDRFVSQSIISPKSQYSPRGTPSPTSRRFSQSSTERPYSPEARLASYREKRSSQDPLPSPTLKRAMTDKQLPTLAPFASASLPPVPANSFFQKTRSLFEAPSALATQALPTITRPLSGYFNGRGSSSPSSSPTPKLQKKGSMASLRSRPSSLYQPELPVDEEQELVPRSLDGDGKPPSPTWSIPTAASAARSGSVSSQRSQGGRKGSHGSVGRVENDLNVWTPSKDIRPRNNNPFAGAMGKGGERERVPLLAEERDGV